MINGLFQELYRNFELGMIPDSERISYYRDDLLECIYDAKEKRLDQRWDYIYLITMSTLLIESFKIINLKNFIVKKLELIAEYEYRGETVEDFIYYELKPHFNTAKQIIDKAVLTNSDFKNKFPRKKKLHKNTDEFCNGIMRTYNMMLSIVYTSSYKDEIEQYYTNKSI